MVYIITTTLTTKTTFLPTTATAGCGVQIGHKTEKLSMLL